MNLKGTKWAIMLLLGCGLTEGLSAQRATMKETRAFLDGHWSLKLTLRPMCGCDISDYS